MSGATDREIAGEPARKDLNRGEREAGGTPCQSDLEEGCQRPHSLGSSPSKIRSSKFPLPPDQTGWNVIAMPPAQSVFHNTFRFIGYIRTGGTIAAGRWGWALCFSVGPGCFPMPEVRCKLYNTCFPFTALFSPGRVFYQHMRERPDFFCFLTTVKIQLKFCCFG